MRLTLFALAACFITASNAWGATYYVSAAGSDSNSGTSTTSPWLHAPGMSTCTGACASTTIQPGDSIVLRGGDVWHFGNNGLAPFAGFQNQAWHFSGSGTATACNVNAAAGPLATATCIYIGVDPSWFSGASWTRPAMDADNPPTTSSPAYCAYDDSTYNLVVFDGPYVIADGLEFRGYCWNSTNPWASVFHIGDYSELKNAYFHGWTMAGTATGCGTCDADEYWGVMSGYVRLDHNVFDGTDSTYGDSTTKATGGTFTATGEVDHNVLNHVSNGIKYNPVTLVHDNYFLNLIEPPVGGTHGNVIEWSNQDYTFSTYYFNNVVGPTAEGETIDMYPGAMASGKSGYIFNNVMSGFNGNAGNCYMIEGDGAGSPGTVHFFNNTSDSPCFMRGLRYTTPPPAIFQNNHFIGYSPMALSSFESALTDTDNGNELFQTEAAANAQGYTHANNYAPTSTGAITVGAGGNLTSVCNSMDNSIAATACRSDLGGVSYDSSHHAAIDNPVAVRPSSGAWDVGAYQFTGAKAGGDAGNPDAGTQSDAGPGGSGVGKGTYGGGGVNSGCTCQQVAGADILFAAAALLALSTRRRSGSAIHTR